MTKPKAPLLEALLMQRQSGEARLHVPGHKASPALTGPEFESLRGTMEIDYTEISGLDDLAAPEGVIREAQLLAALCFGAEETYFLVGGSTAGNLAAITTLCRPGDILLVQRNSHKSVIHGLMLAGARAVFLTPEQDPRSGLAAGLTVETVREALRRYPEAKGVLLTNPNYYGMGMPLEPIAEEVYAAGKVLIVDEAHGAHFGFHPALPRSALSCGADAVIQSTHKMLTALTMGAMLHVQGPRLDRELLRYRLTMLQSSSPSYPILASLDVSRLLLQTDGRQRIEAALECVRRVDREIDQRPWFRRIGIHGGTEQEAAPNQDPFKVVLRDATQTLSGYRLREELERHGLKAEMADPEHVVLVFTLASDEREADRLVLALDMVADEWALRENLVKTAENGKNEGRSVAVTAKDVQIKGTEHPHDPISAPVSFSLLPPGGYAELPLREAMGRRAAEMIIPYPPGIPLLYPGELITEQIAVQLERLAAAGAQFQGAADAKLATIRVLQAQGQES